MPTRVEAVERKRTSWRPWDVRDLWVEVPIDDAWLAAFRLFDRDGALVVGEMRVYPREPEEGSKESSAYFATGERPAGSWSAEMLGSKAPVPAGGLSARVARRASFTAALEAAPRLLRQLEAAEGAKA